MAIAILQCEVLTSRLGFGAQGPGSGQKGDIRQLTRACCFVRPGATNCLLGMLWTPSSGDAEGLPAVWASETRYGVYDFPILDSGMLRYCLSGNRLSAEFLPAYRITALTVPREAALPSWLLNDFVRLSPAYEAQPKDSTSTVAAIWVVLMEG